MGREKFANARFSGERALFQIRNAHIEGSIFENGESPLKECSDIEVCCSVFKWKYPVWYSDEIAINNSFMNEMCRASFWYCNDLAIRDTVINAPKTIRRCSNVKLDRVAFFDGPETLWFCDSVVVNNTIAKGDYFAMNSKNIEVDNLDLVGKYAFDGVENVVIKNSRLATKDAFWNSKNVTVYDSYISGEYLGWNAENLTFINCTIESLQGLCYIKNLKMVDCKLNNTTLSFEYSDVDATLIGHVDSIINPRSGRIKADSIGTLIMESDKINPEDIQIICSNIERVLDRPEY